MGDRPNSLDLRESKRTKFSQATVSTNSQAPKRLTHDEYTVGWICPLQVELIAALEMLDEEHATLPQPHGDHNVYHLGSISGHNIVLAGLWQAGNSIAATVVAQMRRTFSNIRFGLLVGIGGGVPIVTDEGMIRLGHVVVSKPAGLFSGAIQYDRGKAETGQFIRTGALAPPPPVLLLAAQALGAQRARSREDPLIQNVRRIDTSIPGLRRYQFPGAEKDYLFPSEYQHSRIGISCDVGKCDPSQRIPRDTADFEWITVHRGTIASGDLVLRDGAKRDLLSEAYGVLCFEMEAAGALSDFPCLVIRGVSDYCDSHKTDLWHGFAAAAAAAYARQLCFHMPVDQVNRLVPLDDAGLRRMIDNGDDQERHQIAEWISQTNYATSHAHFMNERQEGTGQWFLETTEFCEWVTKKGVLYCPGIPGAGKTIISSIVIDFLHERGAHVAYLFCDYRQKNEQKLESILANILKQFFQKVDTVPEDLRVMHKKCQRHGLGITQKQLVNWLEKVVNSFSRAYIVIDALDESSDFDGTRDAVIAHLLELQQRCNVSLLATSRFIPEITAKFERYPTVEIRATDADVRRFIEGHISEISGCMRRNPELSKHTVSVIVSSVDGMFLLAKLYIDSLKGASSPRIVKTALSKFKTGSDAYNSAYKDAMDRIERQIPNQTQLAMRSLAWLSCARRSLTLTELQCALAVEIGANAFDKDGLPDIEDMISACAGLVSYNEQSHLIGLVHYTTQEYFEREWTSWFPNSHSDISQVCLTYLCYNDFVSWFYQSSERLEELTRQHPLYEYAAANWGYHSQMQHPGEQHILRLLEHDQKAVIAGKTWARLTYPSQYRSLPEKTSSLHFAVQFGLKVEIEILIEKYGSHLLDNFDRWWGSPLSIAVKNGDEAVVETLLHHGASIDSRDGSNRSLLCTAACCGHKSLVSLFLKLGLNVELGDDDLRSPLSWAAGRGFDDIAILLLDAGANFNGADHRGGTPLSYAAQSGHLTMVGLLLERGAQPYQSENLLLKRSDNTPLLAAARSGHYQIVKLLLEQGVDADTADESGRTSLSLAARWGHHDTLKLLLDHGADTDLLDDCSKSALTYATLNGDMDTVHSLLVTGAAVNRIGTEPVWAIPPLEWAVIRNHFSIMDLLLEKGADPNSHGAYSSPLSMAIGKLMPSVIDKLLDHGANPYFKPHAFDKIHNRESSEAGQLYRHTWNDGILQSAARQDHKETLRALVRHGVRIGSKGLHEDLFWAAQHGHTSFIDALLEEGVDIHTRDPETGDTLMSHAVVTMNEALVAFLINKGADIEILDHHGQSPLSKAASRGNATLVDLLAEMGANPGSRDNFGLTPLFYAIASKNEDTVQSLLKLDPCAFDCRDDFGRSPLLLAADENLIRFVPIAEDPQVHLNIIADEMKIVMHTISSPEYEISQDKGEFLILWAATHGHVDVINLLLTKGITHLCEDDLGRSPLTLAVKGGHVRLVKLFLDKGHDVNMRDGAGYGPLSWAFWADDDATIRLLLENGCDPNTAIQPIPTRLSCTPDRHATRLGDSFMPLLLASERGNKSIVNFLLQIGADEQYSMKRRVKMTYSHEGQSVPDVDVISALSLAVNEGHLDIAKALLNHGAGQTACHTSLFLAMAFNDKPLVLMIMQDGIQGKWNFPEHGQSLLFQAAYTGFQDVVTDLLDSGMDPNTFSTHCLLPLIQRNRIDRKSRSINASKRDTPLCFAAQEGHEAVVRTLLIRKANPDIGSPLSRAIRNGHRKVSELLVMYVPEPELRDTGPFLLIKAAADGHLDMVRFLLEKGIPADPQVLTIDRRGQHPLFAAISNKQLDVARLFLENGVSPNVADERGWSVLFTAAESDQAEMLELLLLHGGNAHAVDRADRTPLFLGSLYRKPAAVKVLLQRGNADPQSKTCAGRTPLSVARELGYPEILWLFSGEIGEPPFIEKQDIEDDHVIFYNPPPVGYSCDVCRCRIPNTDPFFMCSLCDMYGKGCLGVCVECAAADLGCFDRLHTLRKMVYHGSKLTELEKFRRWRYA